MQIQILYFQNVKRHAGTPGETLDLPAGATVADLTDQIVAAHPGIGPIASGLLFAVNEEHARRDQALADGDTVALMPPFSGG